MSIKRVKLIDQIRQAIDDSGLSRYRICKDIGMSEATMSRFMNGHGGLSVEMLDKIGDGLDLNITAGVKARKGKGLKHGKRHQ